LSNQHRRDDRRVDVFAQQQGDHRRREQDVNQRAGELVQDERGDADGFDALDFVRAELVEASARLLDAQPLRAGLQPLGNLVYGQRVGRKLAEHLRGFYCRVRHSGVPPTGSIPLIEARLTSTVGKQTSGQPQGCPYRGAATPTL
jgi:hypothetical protein